MLQDQAFLLPRWASRHADTVGDAFGIHPGGGMAALGSTEGICVLDLNWPWEASRVLQQPDTGGCAVLQWHPQPSRGTIASAGRHGNLGLYDLGAQSSARALVASLQGVQQVPVDALAWNLAAAHELAIRTSDGTVALWDVRSGVLQPVSSLMRWDNSAAPEPAAPATGALCWSPRRPEKLASTEGGVVQLWDVRRPGVPLASFRAHGERVSSLEWVGGVAGARK
jgi:WD40 repeat protein